MYSAWLLFSPIGRIDRKTFWLAGIPLSLLCGIALVLKEFGNKNLSAFGFILILCLAWPAWVIQIKRWHDRNKSFRWQMINCIPYVGSIWAIIELGFLKGTFGVNDYGEPQKVSRKKVITKLDRKTETEELETKTKIPQNKLVEAMLYLQVEIAGSLWKSAQDIVDTSKNNQKLKFECDVLSLWILTLAIPDNAIRDEIHNGYCGYNEFDEDQIEMFFSYIRKQYYSAYNIWIKDHQAGLMLGSAILNAFEGSPDDKLQLDIFKTHAAFTLFTDTFISACESVGNLQKKYDSSTRSCLAV
ncbi:MAG: hypothetical protein DRP56_07700 [Planctomycetota bacterium]|nr:MAG: hypothetical protein DRP56_07700 [Planctomycetota bacterium]